MEIHGDVPALSKALAVAFAVGLDVLAISVGVGVARLPFDASLRLGITFAGSEIAMQAIGYALGVGAGHLLGDVATYMGFALLAFIGFVMIRKSFRPSTEAMFDATRGMGLLLTSLSISLDSRGVGIALPEASTRLYLGRARTQERAGHSWLVRKGDAADSRFIGAWITQLKQPLFPHLNRT